MKMDKQLKVYFEIFKERYLFIAGLLTGALILVIIGYFVFLQPTWAERGQLKSENETKEQSYDMKQSELNQLEKVKETYVEAQTEVEKAAKALPSEKEIPELVAQLEQITKEAVALSQEPLVFKSFSVGAAISKSEEKQAEADKNTGESEEEATKATESESVTYETLDEGGYKSLPVSVNLIGSFNALEYYLENLEKNLRIIDVVSINIGGSQSLGSLNFTVNLKVYFQPRSDTSDTIQF
ncbi:type 4a pilus biogenesis protein PilO [Patescibacteria group bacterium]